MHDSTHTNRRTVLKTLTATVVGAGVTTGTAAATGPGGARGRADVEVVAKHDHGSGDHSFELSTDEVAAGWTTFEFDNRSEHTHFAYLPKLPQQALDDAEDAEMTPLEFYVETVTRPFQYFWDTMVDEKTPDPDDLSDYYESFFPPWFSIPDPLSLYGGAGLTSPGHTSTTTVDLDPGKYIMECYVKDGNNDFHSYLGMIDLLTVTEEESGAKEPKSTIDLTLSNAGIAGTEDVRPGRHTVAVDVENQQQYTNLVGHDLHLVRLDGDTSVEDVNDWMNWANPTQFIADGDEPGTFLGGVQDIWTTDLPRTGYLDVTLKPGDYVWVAEVPDPDGKNLLTEFTVPAKGGKGD